MTLAEFQKLAYILRGAAIKATGTGHHKAVSAGEFAIVEDIFAHSPVTVTEITNRTMLAQSFVSRTVERLKQVGFITAAPSAADKRKMVITISETARLSTIRERGNSLIRQTLEELYPERSTSQLDELESALENVYMLLKD